MLRPDHVIEYSKTRAKMGLSDFHQLVEGISIGGMVVVGGNENNVRQFLPVMAKLNRLGAVTSVGELTPEKIDVRKTMTFDLMAIAQLLMTCKNEAFHATMDQTISMLTAMLDDHHDLATAIAVLKEQSQKITRL